jgi:2-C-methyl-D-erythritol 4-phosphate cytidylyltransferase
MTTWGIVVAGGKGSRFGDAKQHVEIDGKPLWRWAADALIAGGVAGVVVVGPVPGGVPGGARRRDSVLAGLDALPPGVDLVMVHDAARPLATAALVRRVAARLAVGDVDGVVPVVPVRDTVKEVDGDRVVSTVDRGRLVAVQTPQGFRLDGLRRAHERIVGDVPDDAALVEAGGGTVVTVAGEPDNLKVTFRSDLTVVVSLLSVREA